MRHCIRALPSNKRHISSFNQGVYPTHTTRLPSASHIPQATIVFMAGEHDDAISRVGDLIDTMQFNSICYVVQARAHALPHGEYHH